MAYTQAELRDWLTKHRHPDGELPIWEAVHSRHHFQVTVDEIMTAVAGLKRDDDLRIQSGHPAHGVQILLAHIYMQNRTSDELDAVFPELPAGTFREWMDHLQVPGPGTVVVNDREDAILAVHSGRVRADEGTVWDWAGVAIPAELEPEEEGE